MLPLLSSQWLAKDLEGRSKAQEEQPHPTRHRCPQAYMAGAARDKLLGIDDWGRKQRVCLVPGSQHESQLKLVGGRPSETERG